ncbi:MAG: rhomboid family intramembrane serine protease [Verrucomicrobiota bacterium]
MRPLRQQFQSFNRSWSGRQFSTVAILIGINVGVFIFQWIIGFYAPDLVSEYLALSGEGVRRGFEWQFVTYMFLHGGFLHLAFNMFTLYFAGREVEVIAGRKHMLGIYFAGGLLGGVAQILLSNPEMHLVGASAGVFAVLIAFTTIYPEMELTLLLFFVIPVRLKAKYLALGLVAVSFLFLGTGAWDGVGHIAHLGGCLAGWLYARQLGFGRPLRLPQFFYRKRERLERIQRMTPEEYISKEIDPILDKISRDGIHSLTRAERKILEKGREKIELKTSRR